MKKKEKPTVLLMALERAPNLLAITVDYFARQRRPRLHFDRIVVMCTAAGQRELAGLLRGPEWRKLERSCGGRLPVPEMVLFRRKGRAIGCIRNAADFAAAQKQIFAVFRELKQAGSRVFCDVGGDQCGLSLLLAFAAMYHGNGDELFQLLLPSGSGMPTKTTFRKSPSSTTFQLLPPPGSGMPAAKGCVQYIAIPFLRLAGLRNGNGNGNRYLPDDYSAATMATQRKVDACKRARVRAIRFDSRARKLTIDGHPLVLTPKAMTVYAFFLDLALSGIPFAAMKEIVYGARLHNIAKTLYPQNSFKFDEALLRESISRINQAMRLRANGGDGAHIIAHGDRWNKRYGISVPASAIHYS